MNKEVSTYKLPEGWIWTTLGEIGIVTSGGTPSTRNPKFWGDDIPWITPADLSNYNQMYISKGLRGISKEGLDYSSAKLIPKRSILFSSRAPIGYVAIAKNDLTTNQGFKNLVITKSLSSEFVYYYFKTIKALAEKMASGTTFLELSATKFSQIPIPLPPLNEQNRIVSKIEELFSELEHAENGLKKAQKQLEVYRQALLKSAFEGKLTKKQISDEDLINATDLLKHIKLERETQFQKDIKQWKDNLIIWERNGKSGKRPSRPTSPQIPLLFSKSELEDLKEIPQSWKWDKIGNFSFVTKLAGFEFSKFIKYSNLGNIPVIKAQNVGKNEFKEGNFSYVDKTTLENLPRIILEGGEILFVFIGAGIGNVGIVPYDKTYLLGPNVAMIKPSKKINNKFLMLFLSSLVGKKHIRALVKATAQGSISMENIREIIVPIASLKEQEIIVQELESRFTLIDNLKNSINVGFQKTTVFRHTILKKAFEGNLLPQESQGFSALQLLDQIKLEKEAYLKRKKDAAILKPKMKLVMEKKKTILEILKESETPISTSDIWQQSIHEGDIESFYSELKEIYNQIAEIKQETVALISLKK